jgi:hypothetical protein
VFPLQAEDLTAPHLKPPVSKLGSVIFQVSQKAV